MNKDQSMNVMNYIDPALIAEADVHCGAVRGRRMAKIGLVAACICVLTVGTVFAASGLIGAQTGGFFRQADPADSRDAYSGYTVMRQGEGISFDGVSAQVLEMAEKGAGKESLRFESMAELEEYLGLELYDNELLEGLQDEAYVENEKNYGAVLHCTYDGEGLAGVDTVSYWGLENGDVTVTVTTEALRLGNQADSTVYVYPDGTVFEKQSYTTSGGSQVDIICCEKPDPGDKGLYGPDPALVSCSAHFYAEGVRYCVIIDSAGDADSAIELMKDILEGFRFGG